jgi:hypothetical protein
MTRPAITCCACLHFANDPAMLESALPGLAALSSARAASRADDGLCRHHDRHVLPTASCAAFVRVAPMR